MRLLETLRLRKPIDSALLYAFEDAITTNAARPGSLTGMIRDAWSTGLEVDLSGIAYGPAHWKGEKFHSKAFPYHHFLAGLVRTQNCRRILEIGTHFGGSALSMLRANPQGKVVTVDVSDINPALHRTPGVVKLTGDAASEDILLRSVVTLGPEPIDLLFIDDSHKFVGTLTNLCLYAMLLRPRLIVMDDIDLNPAMRSIWKIVRANYPNATDCAKIVPEIRNVDVGFGLASTR